MIERVEETDKRGEGTWGDIGSPKLFEKSFIKNNVHVPYLLRKKVRGIDVTSWLIPSL